MDEIFCAEVCAGNNPYEMGFSLIKMSISPYWHILWNDQIIIRTRCRSASTLCI